MSAGTALASSLRHWRFQERLSWGASAATMAALVYVLYGPRLLPAVPPPRRISLREAAAHDGDVAGDGAGGIASAAASGSTPAR